MSERLPREQLRHAYEALRAQATGRIGSQTPPARGLTLLLRSGVAGWMQAWRNLVATPAAQPRSHRATLTAQPQMGLSAELAMVLAQMALGGAAANLLKESRG